MFSPKQPESYSTNEQPNTRNRPLLSLSTELLKTYKQINITYYAKKGKQKPDHDNEQGDLIFTIGEVFDERYEIEDKIGQGSFGVVVKAIDTRENNAVCAIKIIKNRSAFLAQAKIEMDILKLLKDNDPDDSFNCVRYLRCFKYKNHLCIVFEFLAANLYDLLRRGEFNGFSIGLVRRFAQQILVSLDYLSRLQIIHCDLKPENILLAANDKANVKVIDFGSSCRIDETLYTYIQSRFYRSPEVLLGLPYGPSIDMWSLACILVELNTGIPLFHGSDEVDMMIKIVETLGYPPDYMIEKSPHRNKFFNEAEEGSRKWVLKQGSEKAATKSLREAIGLPPFERKSRNLRDVRRAAHEPQGLASDYSRFLDFVQQVLQFDPSLRPPPSQALQHPFFLETPPERSRERRPTMMRPHIPIRPR
ncbi:hypothetical protein GEMRC1_008754 [Eukaryota sp. GEM-RC1]